MRKTSTQALLTNATTTGAGNSFEPWGDTRTYGATGVCDDSGTAVISIEVRNDSNAAWILMGTITITLSPTASGDGFSSIVPWKYVRARITSLSGTNATISVFMGNLPA